MAPKTGKTQKTIVASAEKGGEQNSIWNQHGIEDVYFQREAQVNLWTVMGGIAVAALLTQVTNLVAEIQMGRWYLIIYALCAILMITASWVQNVWGTIILKIQVSYGFVILWIFNLVNLSVICLYVTEPAIFMAASATYILIAVLSQMYLRNPVHGRSFRRGW